MSLNTVPAVGLSPLNVSGLKLSWLSNTTLTLTAGECYNSTATFSMTVDSDITIDAAVNGVNGLDTGSLANSTTYAVFVIADSSQPLVTAGAILSTSATAPYLPFGYSILRRVGWVRTDGSAHFLKFKQEGSGVVRNYEWETPIAVTIASTATSFTAISLATAMPLQETPVYLNVAYVPAVVSNTLNIRPTGSAAAAGSCPIIVSSAVVSVVSRASKLQLLPRLATGNPSLDYQSFASDQVTISVAGYDDYL